MRRFLLCALLPVALTACERGADRTGVARTRAPGHITADGGTSGQVMAANGTNATAGAVAGPAGTPGIPKGAEGNTGGTSPGGNLSDPGTHSASPPMPVRSEKSGTAPPSPDVKTGDQPSPRALQPSAPNKAGR